MVKWMFPARGRSVRALRPPEGIGAACRRASAICPVTDPRTPRPTGQLRQPARSVGGGRAPLPHLRSVSPDSGQRQSSLLPGAAARVSRLPLMK